MCLNPTPIISINRLRVEDLSLQKQAEQKVIYNSARPFCLLEKLAPERLETLLQDFTELKPKKSFSMTSMTAQKRCGTHSVNVGV